MSPDLDQREVWREAWVPFKNPDTEDVVNVICRVSDKIISSQQALELEACYRLPPRLGTADDFYDAEENGRA